MREILDLLRRKEAELQRLEKEIEALRITTSLLGESGAAATEPAQAAAASNGSAPVPITNGTRAAAADPLRDLLDTRPANSDSLTKNYWP